MAKQKKWEVIFHDDFDPEFELFDKDVQDELLATAGVVKEMGPDADRPHVGTLENTKHPNMKELRFKANNGAEIWRAAFAFDPDRNAIVLVAAAKQGTDEDRFYKDLLRKANDRFDKHLKALKAAKKAESAKDAKMAKTAKSAKPAKNGKSKK